MKAILRHLAMGLTRINEALLVAAVLAAFLSTILIILSRYSGILRMGYLTDFTVGAIPWIGMLGAALGFARNHHVGMNVVRDAMPAEIGRRVAMAARFATMAFLLVILWVGISLVHAQFEMGNVTPAMEIPRFCFSLALPVGAAFGIVYLLDSIVSETEAAPPVEGLEHLSTPNRSADGLGAHAPAAERSTVS